jgi:hypothetical protein
MFQATAKSQWKQGQKVVGVYHGQQFAGAIGPETRPTIDGRNVQFQIILNVPITVYGTPRERVMIETNSSDVLYLA